MEIYPVSETCALLYRMMDEAQELINPEHSDYVLLTCIRRQLKVPPKFCRIILCFLNKCHKTNAYKLSAYLHNNLISLVLVGTLNLKSEVLLYSINSTLKVILFLSNSKYPGIKYIFFFYLCSKNQFWRRSVFFSGGLSFLILYLIPTHTHKQTHRPLNNITGLAAWKNI
jgi:hypothetical protein